MKLVGIDGGVRFLLSQIRVRGLGIYIGEMINKRKKG